MNNATVARLAIARRIAPFYARNPKVAAVLVAGSVGAGHADAYSDLELDVFWSAPPTDDERRAPVEASGGAVKTLHPFEEDEWAEELLIDGLKVDTSMFLVETIDRYLADAVERLSTARDPQFLIAAIQHSTVLHGEAIVRRWREKAATYPDDLARKVVAEALAGPPRWYYAPLLAERDDLVFLYELIAAVVRRLLGVLLGLNRMYLPHPNFKWMDHLIGGMALAPPDLAARLRAVYAAPPPDAVRLLDAIIRETLTLVERHMPDVDTGELRGWFTDRRATWDPPAGLDQTP